MRVNGLEMVSTSRRRGLDFKAVCTSARFVTSTSVTVMPSRLASEPKTSEVRPYS